MTENGSNTATNRSGRPFTKGDPRINRKGRPKSFDALRELAQQIAHEQMTTKDEAGHVMPLIIAGHVATVAETILRQWAMSKNPILQKGFIEIAFGKVPDKVEMTGKGGGPVAVKDETPGTDRRLGELLALIDAVRARADISDPS